MPKSASELSGELTEKNKELSVALKSLHTIEQEILLLQREILEKGLRKKDLEISCNKAKHNVRQLGISVKMLTSEFWNTKNL